MAKRRMLSNEIVDSDAFLDMPASSQLLYFHLNMRADDEGFINKPKSIMRICGSSSDDIRLLIAKSFVIRFETGVIVIKHWKINNVLRADRLSETRYKTEKSMLYLKDNGSYTLDSAKGTACCQPNVNHLSTKCQPLVNQMSTTCQPNVRIGKCSIVECSIDKNSKTIVLIEQVVSYLNEKAGTKYRSTSKKTKKFIQARINEKYTLKDFQKVIDIKCDDWLDTEWSKFLRPETLFSNKFEGYLNEKHKEPETISSESETESDTEYEARQERKRQNFCKGESIDDNRATICTD